MNNKKGVSKDSIIKMVISVAMLLAIVAGIYFFIFRDNIQTKEEIAIEANSDILSTDPKETAANYIAANGNMGDIEEDLSEDKILTGEHLRDNERRRLNALDKVEAATIPGSSLITGREKNKSIKFAEDSAFPMLYNIDNIYVSEPLNERKITVMSEVGPVEYEAVDVLVSFDSMKYMLICPTDVSYDGTHELVGNKETFEEMKTTLVKSGDVWFMYEINDSENLLNERFATWQGVSNVSVDETKDEIIKEISVEIDTN